MTSRTPLNEEMLDVEAGTSKIKDALVLPILPILVLPLVPRSPSRWSWIGDDCHLPVSLDLFFN